MARKEWFQQFVVVPGDRSHCYHRVRYVERDHIMRLFCGRFVDVLDRMRMSKAQAEALGLHPCRRCWREDRPSRSTATKGNAALEEQIREFMQRHAKEVGD